MFQIAARQPAAAFSGQQLGIAFLGNHDAVRRVSTACSPVFVQEAHLLERVLAQRLEHAIASLPVERFRMLHQAFLDQRRDASLHVDLEITMGIAHRLCAFERPPAGKDGKPPKQPLLGRR